MLFKTSDQSVNFVALHLVTLFHKKGKENITEKKLKIYAHIYPCRLKHLRKKYFFFSFSGVTNIYVTRKRIEKRGGGERNPHKFLHYKQFIFEQ